MKYITALSFFLFLILFSCSGKENQEIKNTPVYFSKDSIYEGEAFKLYFNKNLNDMQNVNIEGIDFLLWLVTSDGQINKKYSLKPVTLPNNDSIIYVEFAVPMGINNLGFGAYKNNKSYFFVETPVYSRNGKIIRNSNSFKLEEENDLAKIWKSIEDERKMFYYNLSDYFYIFLNYRKEKGDDFFSLVSNEIERLKKEIESKPPQALEDKIDYYSFMAMAYACIFEIDKSIKYLKILQFPEFVDRGLKNTSGFLNLSKIPLFYMNMPNSNTLNVKQKELLVELMKTGLSINSKDLVANYNRFFKNQDINRENPELAKIIASKSLEYIDAGLNEDYKYFISNYSNLYSSFDYDFTNKEEAMKINRKIIPYLKKMYYKDKYSKDTNDYYFFKDVLASHIIMKYYEIAEYYKEHNEIDSLKNIFKDIEENFSHSTYNKNSIRSISWYIKDLYADRKEIDSATKYFVKGLEYEFVDSKFFKEEFDKFNKIRKANKFPELDYQEVTKSLRPKSVEVTSLAMPQEFNFLKAAKDSIIFFITIDDYCKLCNADASNLNKILNTKIKNNAKIAYYFISNQTESQLNQQPFDEGFNIMKKSDAVNKFLRLDTKETSNMAVYKYGRIIFIDRINSDPSYIDNLINNDI